MSTAAKGDRLTLYHVASSGIHLGMAMLVKDKDDKKSRIDSIQEDWANKEKIDEVLQEITFNDSTLTLEISDELGKIQLNSLLKSAKGHDVNDTQAVLIDRLLDQIIAQYEDQEAFEQIDKKEIINSMIDWLDSGDDDLITGDSGAESDYYENLDPPYTCRNGPFQDISEVALVKGINPQIFYSEKEKIGLSNFTTNFGAVKQGNTITFPGKININTAPLPVLYAMVGEENKDCAEAIDNFRKEKGEEEEYINPLAANAWYKDLPECKITTIKWDKIARIITHSSDIFRINSKAKLNEQALTITAIVKRNRNKSGKNSYEIISWQPG